MKRSPMARGSGFAQKTRERPILAFPAPIRQVAKTVICQTAQVQAKECAVRSEPYRRLVASMPCVNCSISGYSQAAHPNTGKGGGIKTDDRLCFPLCCDRPGVQGCHPKFDQGALYTQAQRRTLEIQWSADTLSAIVDTGAWPDGLEPLPVGRKQLYNQEQP